MEQIINNIITNYINEIFKKANYQEDIENQDKEKLKKIVLESEDLNENFDQIQKEELNSGKDIIFEDAIKEINSKKESLPKWEDTKEYLIEKSEFYMENRLNWPFLPEVKLCKLSHPEYSELETIVHVLIQHIKDKKITEECKTKEREEELMEQIEELANKIAQEYSNKRKSEGKSLIRVNEEKKSWKRYINKKVQIRSILNNSSSNLDIEGESEMYNGVRIILWYAHGHWNQKFKMVLNEDGTVTFSNGDYSINVSDGEAKNGTQINIWETNFSKAQKFYIEEIGNDWFRIHSSINQNYCIDVNGGCSDNLTKIQLWEKNNSDAQKFKFIDDFD